MEDFLAFLAILLDQLWVLEIFCPTDPVARWLCQDLEGLTSDPGGGGDCQAGKGYQDCSDLSLRG